MRRRSLNSSKNEKKAIDGRGGFFVIKNGSTLWKNSMENVQANILRLP
jgi:hypothetical protein